MPTFAGMERAAICCFNLRDYKYVLYNAQSSYLQLFEAWAIPLLLGIVVYLLTFSTTVVFGRFFA